MNFQFYQEKLFASEGFQKFKKEHADSYFCSGFFVIDKEGKESRQHLDYFSPSLNRIFSFKLEEDCVPVEVEQVPTEKPVAVFDNLDFDFGEVEKLINSEMEKKEIKSKIQKILLSLQNFEGKDFLVGTVFISGMGMIKIKINVVDMKVEEFVKKSFMDMINVFKKKD